MVQSNLQYNIIKSNKIPNQYCIKKYSITVIGYKNPFLGPKVFKRYFPGNLAILKESVQQVSKNIFTTAYKGVPGAYTLHNNVAKLLWDDQGAFNFHLYNFLKLYQNGFKPNMGIPQQMFNKISMLTEKESLWYLPKFKGYGLTQEKPYSLMFPITQNVLSYTYHRKYLDISTLNLPYNITVDLSEYLNTGMTLQNMLELNIFCNVVRPFNDYAIETYGKYNIKFKAINALLHAETGNTTKRLHDVQTNSDFSTKIYYVENGIEKEFPFDSKFIQYPEKQLLLFNGSLSVSIDYDFLLHFERIKGALSNILKKSSIQYSPKVIDRLTVWYNNLTIFTVNIKKEKMKLHPNMLEVTRNYNNLVRESFKILCEPIIKDMFPSIIQDATMGTNLEILDETILEELKAILEIMCKKTNQYPAHYFPIMGKENDKYCHLIEKFIESLPQAIQRNARENFSIWFEYINKNAITI